MKREAALMMLMPLWPTCSRKQEQMAVFTGALKYGCCLMRSATAASPDHLGDAAVADASANDPPDPLGRCQIICGLP